MSGPVRVSRRDEIRQRSCCDIVGCSERRGERPEIDIGAESPHRVDGGEDVPTRLTFDEWFDRELDPQHDPSVIGQSRPITLRSSLARTLQSRPAMSKASARRVRAARNEPFHSLSKA